MSPGKKETALPEITEQNPILIIAGTNRPGSYCLRVANRLQRHYRNLDVPHSLLSLQELPQSIFLPEAYAKKPKEFLPIQQRVLDAAGLHMVVPEYNGGFPGVLKLFIDHLKFPDSFEHKPVCFTGEANGMWGAFRPVEQIQMIFGYRNAYVFPHRVFIPRIQSQFDGDGNLSSSFDQLLHDQAMNFPGFVRKL